ncbi:hypothetical protein [Nocardioides sp.]|uniref:hypothetical protein n=1 Tax=Nocardioides sp. TaxID=35761 RepID=UPI003D104998
MLKSSRMLIVAVALLVSTAACSGDDDPKGDKSPSASPTAASSGVITPTKLPDIPKFDGKNQGIIKDVVVDSCDTDPGTVKAAGTVTNSAKQSKDIVVVMGWAATTGGDLVARGVATLKDVPSGETVDWDVEADLKFDGAVGCVPTAWRGTLR